MSGQAGQHNQQETKPLNFTSAQGHLLLSNKGAREVICWPTLSSHPNRVWLNYAGLLLASSFKACGGQQLQTLAKLVPQRIDLSQRVFLNPAQDPSRQSCSLVLQTFDPPATPAANGALVEQALDDLLQSFLFGEKIHSEVLAVRFHHVRKVSQFLEVLFELQEFSIALGSVERQNRDAVL